MFCKKIRSWRDRVKYYMKSGRINNKFSLQIIFFETDDLGKMRIWNHT